MMGKENRSTPTHPMTALIYCGGDNFGSHVPTLCHQCQAGLETMHCVPPPTPDNAGG